MALGGACGDCSAGGPEAGAGGIEVAMVSDRGCRMVEGSNRVSVQLPVGGTLGSSRVLAGSEPLYSSDWVPFAALLLSLRSDGVSEIIDDVFIDRLQFLDVLAPRGLPPL